MADGDCGLPARRRSAYEEAGLRPESGQRRPVQELHATAAISAGGDGGRPNRIGQTWGSSWRHQNHPTGDERGYTEAAALSYSAAAAMTREWPSPAEETARRGAVQGRCVTA